MHLLRLRRQSQGEREKDVLQRRRRVQGEEDGYHPSTAPVSECEHYPVNLISVQISI